MFRRPRLEGAADLRLHHHLGVACRLDSCGSLFTPPNFSCRRKKAYFVWLPVPYRPRHQNKAKQGSRFRRQFITSRTLVFKCAHTPHFSVIISAEYPFYKYYLNIVICHFPFSNLLHSLTYSPPFSRFNQDDYCWPLISTTSSMAMVRTSTSQTMVAQPTKTLSRSTIFTSI